MAQEHLGHVLDIKFRIPMVVAGYGRKTYGDFKSIASEVLCLCLPWSWLKSERPLLEVPTGVAFVLAIDEAELQGIQIQRG